MKQKQSFSTLYLGAILAIAVISAVVYFTAAIISPNAKQLFKHSATVTTVTLPAENFMPVDANKDLTRQKSRLIVVENFHAVKLDNNRSLHIYLPPGYYENREKRFPVLYAQDGKSVYDLSDWSKESLNMHRTADQLISEGKIKEIIVVGIDNIGNERLNEYAHWDGIDRGNQITAKGLLYEDFVLHDVKPFIDKNFRTLADRDNTAMLGGSMGGFVTFNIGFRHPDIFSQLAMMSPYLGWGNGKLYNELSQGEYSGKKPLKLWIDAGSEEKDFLDMVGSGVALLLNQGYQYPGELAAYEAPGGEHTESSWEKRIESILLYFYGDIGKPKSVELFIKDEINLSSQRLEHINAVITYDSGFKMTDLFGRFEVENPDILRLDSVYGNIIPHKEGTTSIRYTSPSGLTAEAAVTVVK